MPRRKSCNASMDMGLSITEAVLKQYDSGTKSPPAILSALMCNYPVLTLATISNIIRMHRRNKTVAEKTEQPPKPKTPIQILQDSIAAKCAWCQYHQAGRPCVMPLSMCPYPEMDEDAKRMQQLIQESKANKKEVKVRGGKILYTKKPRSFINEFDDIEREFDELNEEKTVREEADAMPFHSPGPLESQVVDDAVFAPDEFDDDDGILDMNEEDMALEDFADILAPDILPPAQSE